jgi:hypothetical protein
MKRICALVSLLGFAACAGKGYVRVPKADATPPQAALDVAGEPGPMRLAVGGEAQAVELRESDSLVLTASAADDGGVKDMVLQGNALVTCKDPATGKTFSKTTGFLRRHVPGSTRREIAPAREDTRFVLRGGDIARLCPGGRLESAVGQARVQASNFHGGGAATPHLEFRVALSEVAAAAIPMPATPSAAEQAASGKHAATAAASVGFDPGKGVGGSAMEAPAAAPAPRMCPRASAPGRAAETRAADRDAECIDPPVPSMVPPSGAAPAGSALRGTHAAQTTQIRRI